MASNQNKKMEIEERATSLHPAIVFSDDFPLCVDLDGTLISTDSLAESWLAAMRRSPWRCLGASLALLRGRSHFKTALADIFVPSADQFPYRQEVLHLLEQEAVAGRVLVLATGASRLVATAIASHLGYFTAVLSSDTGVNLTSRSKAQELENRFGRGQFYYVGNSAADLPAWQSSAGAVVVGRRTLARKLSVSGVPVLGEFPGNRLSLALIAQSLRVHQWSKNLLVFVAILLGHRFRDASAWITATILFSAMSLVASVAYLVNDLFDLEADRVHPEKRKRPFASGTLGVMLGVAGIPLLLLVAAGLSAFLPLSSRLWLCGYLALALVYTFVLKEKLLIDVFVLAGLYTLRVLAGGSATGIEISPWTLAFSMFLFLSLAMAKRYSELISSAQTIASLPRRNYYRSDLTMLGSLGTASGYIAVLVLALYIHAPEVASLYRQPWLLWGICPLAAYWISRVWVFASRAALPGDPILFAFRDRVSYLVGGLCVLLFLLAALLH